MNCSPSPSIYPKNSGKLKPGGLLLIDNTDWQHPPHVHVPTDWPLVHPSRNVLTRTSIWQKP